MKQTAVDWLVKQLTEVERKNWINNKILSIGKNTLAKQTFDGIIEQAKQMERELIKDSCTMAIMQWNEWDKTNYLDLYDHKIEGAEIWSEDYVKELY